jgi:hypothetical protein
MYQRYAPIRLQELFQIKPSFISCNGAKLTTFVAPTCQ